MGFVYTEDKKTRKISGFYFYFYSTRPFCPPPPVQNQKCNLFVSKDKIHSPTRKFLPPYPTLHTTTPQTVHIHRYTLSQLHETERRHLETNRIFNQPTLTSNFPLGLFFFSFSSNKSCLLPITDETPGMSSLLPPPIQATHLIQIRWERKPPPAENWDLGQRLTFVM